MKKKMICLGLALILLFSLTSCGRRDAGTYRIALIPMDSINQHWLFMNEGAQKAAEELQVKVTFLPPVIADETGSVEQLINAVAARYDAILYAPFSTVAPVAALREADQTGVKLIYVDAMANYQVEAAYKTDNVEAGRRVGENMLTALTEAGITSGKIGHISVRRGLDTVSQRDEGFRDVFADTDFELLEIQYCDNDISKAQNLAENYITQGVVAMYGCNESSITGIGNAVKASGRDDIIAMGIDTSDALAALLKEGYIQALITQNPYLMGYEGVKGAVAALNGEDLGGIVVDTGVNVLFREDVE